MSLAQPGSHDDVRSPAAPPALAAHGLVLRYGGVTAVDGVDLELHRGEVTGLIGPNGAGKTSLIDVLSGFVRASAGRVELAGTPIDRLRPHQRMRRGLARMFQHLELCAELTVAENLSVAARRVPGPATDRITEVVDELGLGAELDRRVAELSQGRRKIVALARAVVSRPSVVLMDEPAAGLGPADTASVGSYLRSLAAAGTAVLLVDHDMGFVLPTCDRIVVLNFGSVLASGSPAEIRRDPAVQAAYLGEAA
ncbi:ABC transporter ATP-binding protein [Pseudonocardia xishanensis]|uniref:ABC transporter domain-containing protein n=1 Tax=Pseudonocardia xishanensis TaxID=630995 RepID=A0ABP8RUZ5_9PSEU